MSGDPTDVQLLTCKAREVDVSMFPHALANRINANYGNYIFFLFVFQRQVTWSLIIISCIMVVACKGNRPVTCLVMKKVRIYFSSEFTGGQATGRLPCHLRLLVLVYVWSLVLVYVWSLVDPPALPLVHYGK